MASPSGFRGTPFGGDPTLPFIRFDHVRKTFGRFVAIDDLSLDINEGEFFALLGPSGCGKTTLMRMLAGFEAPTSGDIYLDGVNLNGVPAHKRPTNMMFQSYALFPHLSVWDNIAFGLRREGLGADTIAARVEAMLTLVQLTPQARRKPHQLSGGQRQRVALARSLAKEPRVLLLDEPLAALDKKLRAETQFELTEIQRRLGITFIIVTHDQDEAMVLADRIAVMREGAIEQIGTPSEIYEAPVSRAVATFIGETNLMEGKVARVSPSEVELAVETLGTRVRAQAGEGASGGAAGCVAVRPEKIVMRPAESAPLDGANAVSGVVVDAAYMGEDTLYRVRLDTGHLLKVRRSNTREGASIAIGDQVMLTWDEADAVFLER
ncbi:ABC transporter ATP-binding protein [Acuticoccus kandeliae]|uniref:ABC transporter ATP-binding protein n=1 Tax=Acuticoccus kandeliae TaxID=2073160 RepID=UPI000D3E6DBF|nr:ABC transporter ATP-binding protein [Acuticoccus kandeliae]